LGVTHSGILLWEQTGERRMSKINDAAIRMLCAEELGIKLESKWSKLATEEELVFSAKMGPPTIGGQTA
jgi:hypothetical protein